MREYTQAWLTQDANGQTEEETADAALFYEHKQLDFWEEQRRGECQRGTWSTDAAVEAVEGRVEVETWPQAVHLQKHLSKEQS